MANIGDILLQPEAGWKRYNDNDKLIQYKSFIYESPSTGCYGNSCTYVKPYGTNLNAEMKFNFIGTSLRIIGWSGSNRATEIDITIDGITNRFNCRLSNDKNVLLFESNGLGNTIHEVVINNIKNDNTNVSPFLVTCVDINENGVLIPELSRDYEFPVKIGNEEDVAAFAESLIGGEEQLLITREGKLFLTDGNGGYSQLNKEADLSNIYTKEETDDLIADNLHTHENTKVLSSLGDSAGMLSYNGKVVVNNSEYSFKTLPRRKAPTSSGYTNSTQGGRLPWQV